MHPSEAFRDADPALRPLVENLHTQLITAPLDLAAIKTAMIAPLEFLSSSAGRTDENCRAVDGFFFHYDAWLSDQLPDAYHDIMAHMDALHDTMSAPHIAENFQSKPEQLLERVGKLSYLAAMEPTAEERLKDELSRKT